MGADAISEFRSVCNKMSEEIIKPFTAQKEHIYVDADLIYDYRLGALLALIRSEEDFNYVWENLDAYATAPSLTVTKFFPKLGITEEDLDKVIKNPEYFNFLTAAAPPSQFMEDVESVIRVFNTLNESREVKNPVKFHINQRQIKIHPHYKRGIIETIHNIDKSIIVDFTEYPTWFDVPETFLEQQDFICVYDLKEFLTEGTTSQKLLSAVPSKLMKSNILTLLQSDKDFPKVEDFVNLKVLMEVMCDKFTFIPKTIRKEGIVNG